MIREIELTNDENYSHETFSTQASVSIESFNRYKSEIIRQTCTRLISDLDESLLIKLFDVKAFHDERSGIVCVKASMDHNSFDKYFDKALEKIDEHLKGE